MAEHKRFQVLVLNQISANGLKQLPADRYTVGKDVAEPDAVLVRSADLHATRLPGSVLAIGRAGAGTHNIPLTAISAPGVPVFPSRAFSPIRKQAPAMYRHQGGIWLVRQKAHDSSTSAPSARKPRKEQSHRQKRSRIFRARAA